MRYTSIDGLDVLVLRKETSAKTFFASLYVRAGSVYEEPKEMGISHFLEHSVFLGTQRFPTREKVERHLLSLGGHYNAYTGVEDTVYTVEGVESALKEGIEFLCDITEALLEDKREIAREKKVVMSELEQETTASGQWMDSTQIACETLYAGTVLSQAVIGSKKTLKQLNADKLRYYHRSHYGKGNICLVVVSALPEDEILKRLEQEWLRPIRSVTRSVPHPMPFVPFPDMRTVKCVESKTLATEMDMFLVCKTPSNVREGIILHLMNAVLFHSELSAVYGAARKKGLAYMANGRLLSAMGHTMFHVSTALTPDKIQAFYELLTKAVSTLPKKGIDKDFFHDCKNYFEYSRQSLSERPLSLADLLVRRLFLKNDTVWLPSEELAVLPEITPDEVIAAMIEVFSSKRVVTVLKGDGMTPQFEAECVAASL